MRWYLSADPDRLGRPFDASTVEEAIAMAVSKRIVKRGTEVTVRHNVRLVGDGPDWLFANVQSVAIPGDPPKAEPAPSVAPVTPVAVAAAPEKVAATPDKVAATPDKVASAPEKVAATPDKVAATPATVAATPEVVPQLGTNKEPAPA